LDSGKCLLSSIWDLNFSVDSRRQAAENDMGGRFFQGVAGIEDALAKACKSYQKERMKE